MINIIIVFLLFFGFFRGLKRGFILQFFHLVGFIVSFIIAVIYYKKLSPHLSLWIPYPELSGDSTFALFLQTLPLKTGFYNAISFVIIFFVTKIILQIIASMLDFVTEIPVLHTMNKWLGAMLGFLEIYFILFITLYLIALIPVEELQAIINDSKIAMYIIEKTPFVSKYIEDLWFTNIDRLLH